MREHAETYPDYAINDAIAVASTACLVAAVLGRRTVVVERAIRPSPHATLPVFRYCLVVRFTGIQLEAVLAGAFPRLRRYTGVDGLGAVVGD
jgi:hypothetical protein